jgi:DNA mismatch repair protein MutS
VDPELDECRLLQRDAGAWLSRYQEELITEHKLPGIKVGFNKVFGYYIELTASQSKSAPAVFSRKQTLKNAERYITPELKEFEDKVTTAETRAVERERLLFEKLCADAAACIPAIAAFAREVAELDVLLCFAERAVRRGWVKPEMSEAPVLNIAQGRHPVLEQVLGDGFVPNDVALGGNRPDSQTATQGSEPDPLSGCLAASLALITGPNMAGKSTFIRQTALIVLLAHAGSFVPAEAATIGVCDRIFTRVGADDALHAGQSTFMVEMTETATILNNCSPQSLVILDEIGRGTSTLDGLSLAWAIAEHLAGGAGQGACPGPRTLFATHYHELTELEERLPGRVKNLHVSVREWGDQIVFLHRILPGRSDRSYGVHVARLAGIPAPVVRRAGEVLASLAVQHGPATAKEATARIQPASPPSAQLSLFTEYVSHPVVGELRELKLDALSPIQAFDELRRLRALVQAAPGQA